MVLLNQFRKRMPNRNRSNWPAPFRPWLESLEDRTLLSPCEVTNNLDSGVGSLRQCMSSSFDSITFSDPFDIQLQSALPVITWTPLTILGPTADPLDLRVRGEGAADPYPIFVVAAGKDVGIENITISHGFAANGGGIKNSGTLVVSNVVVELNIAAPVDGEREILGAGIYNAEDADLTITDGSRIRNNKIMGIAECIVAGGDSFLPPCPYLFAGSAVYNGTNGELEFNGGSFIEFNTVCDLADVCKGSASPFPDVTFYGAVYNNEGEVAFYDSTVQNNTLRPRDPGDINFRGHGAGLQSGCRTVFVPCVSVVRSTFSGNVLYMHGIANSSSSQSAAHGAAISMAGVSPPSAIPEAFISNSTFTANWIESTVTGAETGLFMCNPQGGPCKTAGGGLWSKGMHIYVEFTTFVANGINTADTLAEGGGLHVSTDGDAILRLKSVIVADNLIDGLLVNFGPFNIDAQSLGYNLFDDNPDWKVGTDTFRREPSLQPLGNYGGVTETMRPLVGSPAINMGSPNGVTDDQRGLPRPVGVARDVGAVECQGGFGDCVGEGDGPGGGGGGDGPDGIPPPPDDGADGIGGFVFQSASLGNASTANQLPARAATLEVQELPAEATAFFVDSARIGSAGPIFYWNDPLRSSMTAAEFALLGSIE